MQTTYGTSKVVNDYDHLGRLTTSTIHTGAAQYPVNIRHALGAMSSNLGVSYDGYIENSGWQEAKTDGETSGTVGQSLKYQATTIQLTNVPTDSNDPLSGIKIKYQTHVSNIGWQDWVYDGTVAGVTDSDNQIEAIRIQLEGAPAGYQVWYQAHVQDSGWMDPVKGGEMAGTTGLAKRLEALRIFIIKPGPDSKDTTRIESIDNNGNPISYTYDPNGNIQTSRYHHQDDTWL